ncbi:AAA family ATPase [Chloroflexota bacterium]
MIPSSLKIRNFMPYRGDMPPFSFDGIHIACICGDNGNGKSALIDAITWALWGKSRAKSDEDLIHQGEADMEVEFEFFSGKQLYRIVRKLSKARSRKASGQSSLDLFIADNGGFKTISGDIKTQTQQRIISLLNMDYDTFINSAFLRQGHADEFSKQQPAKRKEVLANILGLSIYDQLEDKAREISKQQQLEKTQLERAIADIELELAQKDELEASLSQSQAELARLEAELKERQSLLNRLRREMESMENKRLQLARLDKYITEDGQDIALLHSQTEQRQVRIKQYRELLAQRQSIEEGYSRFAQAKILNDELNRKLQLLNSMNDRKRHLEQAIQDAQSKLLAEHAVAQNNISRLEAVARRLDSLKKDKAGIEAEQRQLASIEGKLEASRQEANKLRAAAYETECSLQRRQQEIKDIEEKLELLHLKDSTKCPLCETEIGLDGLSVVEAKYSADKKKKITDYTSQEDALAAGKAELSDTEKRLQGLESGFNQGNSALQGKAGVVKQAIAEAEEAAGKLEAAEALLDEIENRLAGKDFAGQEHSALNKLETELSALKYNAEEHRQAGQTLAESEKYEPLKHRLDEAEKMLGLEQGEVAGAAETVKKLTVRMDNYNKEKAVLSAELDSLPHLESDLRQAENEYQSVSAKQKQAQEETGVFKGKLEHLLKQEQKQQSRKARLDEVLKESRLYLDLAQAFGKKGIQAMLIEMTLPDIENEANKLLAKMTDNRMHIKIETQRQSKKGDTLETLDIIISDELGARNYEMFSGGEAFRIDFAIRIALSRLLAKRAGAPLPTLIIDEGFGTQDSSGIEKLKEAINSIQDDFDKIIVITHIDELKEAFPTRINVVKTADGSTLEVS